MNPMVKVGAGGVIVLLKVNVVTTADIRFSTTVSVSVPFLCLLLLTSTYFTDDLSLELSGSIGRR